MVSVGRTALYRFFDSDGTLLYVGITDNTKERFYQHSTTKPWWSSVASQRIEWLDTREEALAAERVAIRGERPIWNIKLSLNGVSSEAEALFTAYREAREEALMLLPQVKAIAPDLMRAGATVGQLAEWTGLTDEVFRRIGRANEIERLREPTVGKDAKPKNEKES